jgi:hypothetical protein
MVCVAQGYPENRTNRMEREKERERERSLIDRERELIGDR